MDSRFNLIRVFFAILFFGLIACNGTKKDNSKKEALGPPNVLIIVADDLGWNDVSFHGSEIQTPALDNLAANGIVLNRFYACPICTPTRFGIMTGKYPNRFGLRYEVCTPSSLNGMPQEEVTIAEIFGKHGYRNRAAFGKWHLGHSHEKYHPLNHGFTYFYGHYNGALDYYTHKRDAELDWHRNFHSVFEEGYTTDLIGKDVIKYISEVKNDGPFFAYVAFNAPHSPMQAKEEDLLKYGYDPNGNFEEYKVGGQRANEREKDIYGMKGRGNTLRQTYSAMVSSLDHSVGAIIEHLKKEEIYNNTIIWFLSDNGGISFSGGDNTPLRGQKGQEWEGGVRVVSMIKLHTNQAKIMEVDQVVSYIDILPTLASLVGLDGTFEIDGIDVKDVFNGIKLPERYIFLGKNAVVTDKWKLVKDTLYQIDTDPYETTSVSSKFPDKYLEMKSVAQKFMSIEEGGYSYQEKGWIPPKNWKMPE